MQNFLKISSNTSSNEHLMKLITQGDKRAFEILYDRFFNKLVWFAGTYISDKQKAEDIVQEVFIKIIGNPKQFDATKKFTTWIYTLTGNACKNALRNEENRSRILEQNFSKKRNETQQNHSLDTSLLKEKIKLVCNQLSKKEQAIFSLRFEQELSIKEISEIINIPEGSVKSGLYYLLKKFTPHLKDFKL